MNRVRERLYAAVKWLKRFRLGNSAASARQDFGTRLVSALAAAHPQLLSSSSLSGDLGVPDRTLIAFFVITWLPRSPRKALLVLGLQAVAGLAAAAPVFLLKW